MATLVEPAPRSVSRGAGNPPPQKAMDLPCYSPIDAWRGPGGEIVFNSKKALSRHHGFKIPCGQCIGCRTRRARDWAIRCVHEAQLHERNCFVTLTYDKEHLPADLSVNPRHFQLFMKKLRKHYAPRTIRYLHCGEYGEETKRPHYHAILFNVDFGKDRELLRQNPPMYASPTLDRIWGKGLCTIGLVNYQTASYVAQYVLKKQTGEAADDEYTREAMDFNTGEVRSWQVRPPYVTMSRGGRTGKGIGHGWLEKYRGDVYPHDQVMMDGKTFRPPRYYDKQLDEQVLDEMKRNRVRKAKEHSDDTTPERLSQREKSHKNRAGMKRREPKGNNR